MNQAITSAKGINPKEAYATKKMKKSGYKLKKTKRNASKIKARKQKRDEKI